MACRISSEGNVVVSDRRSMTFTVCFLPPTRTAELKVAVHRRRRSIAAPALAALDGPEALERVANVELTGLQDDDR